MATLPATITDAGFLSYLGACYPTPSTTLTDAGATALRTRVLTTAYVQLAAKFDVDGAPAASVQDATYAQALFLYNGGTAMLKRASLRAQGVISAGIVKETYSEADAGICPEAAALLQEYAAGTTCALVQREREMYDE